MIGYPFSVVWNYSIYKDTNNPHHLQQRTKRCKFGKISSRLCNDLAKRGYIFAGEILDKLEMTKE
jgi:hypothetical protein